MNKRTSIEVITRQDLQNLVTSIILRKKEFNEKEILEEVLQKIEIPENYVWIPAEKRIKECIENTIKMLYLSGIFDFVNSKYVMKRTFLLD